MGDFDVERFVDYCINTSIHLASQELSVEEFRDRLYRNVSRELKLNISFSDLECIIQPLANLRLFQNGNGPWVNYLDGNVFLGSKPENEEIRQVTRAFLEMYGEEIKSRASVVSNNYHQQS